MNSPLRTPRIVMIGALAVAPVCAGGRSGAPPMHAPSPKRSAPAPKTQVDRVERMHPEERDRALRGIPEDRKKKLEQQLQQYKSLPPEEKQRLKEQYDRFQQLPREQQDALRKLGKKLNDLPAERQDAIKEGVSRLRQMTPEERAKYVASDEFKKGYSGSERTLIQRLDENLPK